MNDFGQANTQGQLPLWVLFLRTAGVVELRLEAVLGETGLSLSKFGVLHHLIQAGDALPLSRLAEKLSCVKSNITQVVDRLEVEGLVKRVDDPQDRRTVLAAVTEEGRRRYETADRAVAEAEKQLFECLPERDRAQLDDLLVRLSNI